MNKDDLEKGRKIVARIVVEGKLVLETPTRFGNGESNGLVDMTLARDPLAGQPLLTGASIAGALRSYLRSREVGYQAAGGKEALERLLFGIEEGAASEQSWLVTFDALAEQSATELRDGVAIDPVTRTARDQKKYDLELLAAGAVFPLRLELLVRAGEEERLRRALAIALQGFERGEIPMGARKRRGFGRCRVQGWQVKRYQLTEPKDLLAWLERKEPSGSVQPGTDIAKLLAVADSALDQRCFWEMEATFGLAGSLLIRSGSEEANAPDMAHLKSQRPGGAVPVLPGTSLAGALRARALRIGKTVGTAEAAVRLVDDLFGPQIERSDDVPRASRLWVEERVIEKPLELVVNRVKLDRFTGGSFPTALFSQQPLFGVKETEVTMALRVQNPREADIGLLLLLLKDLWTEDLPIGGEASVGRGRLQGRSAQLAYHNPEQKPWRWVLRQEGTKLMVEGDRARLQGYVEAFCQEVRG